MALQQTPREKKTQDWRHNDRPNKPRNAVRYLTHECEWCHRTLYRKGVYVMGYRCWCTLCGNVLKKKYMSKEFKAQVLQYRES